MATPLGRGDREVWGAGVDIAVLASVSYIFHPPKSPFAMGILRFKLIPHKNEKRYKD